MSRVAKMYIGLVIASGAAILLIAVNSWTAVNLRQFVAFLTLVAFASTLKIRVPRTTSTMSPNFAFLLGAMVVLPFSQVVVLCLAAAFVQSMWRPKRSLQLVKVSFSAAALVVSGAFAFSVSHLLTRSLVGSSSLALILLAGCFYMPANTILVSIVMGLAERHPLKQIFGQCYQAVFPYFILGIVLTALIQGALPQTIAWQRPLLLAPAMILVYAYFLLRANQMQRERSGASERDHELVGASS
jgi:hypothetical protein